MYATIATEPGSDAPNEDWAGCLPDALVIADGVTLRPGIESGCIHGTPWYVRQLGARLLRRTIDGTPLMKSLADSIAEVAVAHGGWCDLTTIGAPSAAVAALRVAGGDLEWLVLADVTVVLDTDAGLQVISDNRVSVSVAGLDARTPELAGRIRDAREEYRNRPGGYWVTTADPDTARHALTGSVPLAMVRQVLVVTDGAARLVDVFGSTWRHALSDVPSDVPQAMIRETRRFEAKDPECARWPRMKPADDATAVLWVPDSAGAASGSHAV